MRPEIVRLDSAVDRALDRVRGPALDGVVYRLSSAADHSLLWQGCGAVVALVRGGDTAFAARFAAAMGAESLLTNGVVKSAVPAGAAGATTTTSTFSTACIARSRARSRRGTPRPRSAPRPCSAAGPAGMRSPPASPRPGSTCGCTTHPTSPSAPRSAWYWASPPAVSSRRRLPARTDAPMQE